MSATCNEPATDTVFVVEGEKDADRLAAFGLVATTNVFGAGKAATPERKRLLDEVNGHIEDIYKELDVQLKRIAQIQSRLTNFARR